MEAAFKVLFFVAIVVFCVVVIGMFLLAIKIGFLFSPEIEIMGIKMVPTGF